MNIFSLLNLERTVACMNAGSKKRALESLSAYLSPFIPTSNKEKIFDKLIARERLGSTGLGSGVAIPHCRLSGLDAPIGAMATLKNPINFDSPDNQDVDIIFCLIVPEKSHEEHLQILAHLAEIFINPELCQQIRNTKDNTEILGILHRWQQNAAA